MTSGDFHVEPHPVPAELEPDYRHADPPDITPPRDPVGDIIRAELTAERVGVTYAHAVPPDHTVDPTDLDEDTHPTSAWLTIGDVVDTDTWKRIRERLRAEMRDEATSTNRRDEFGG